MRMTDRDRRAEQCSECGASLVSRRRQASRLPSPSTSFSDGRSEVALDVRLVDESGMVRAALRDTEVALSASLGTLASRTVTVPGGRINAVTTLTATRSGCAT